MTLDWEQLTKKFFRLELSKTSDFADHPVIL